MRPSAQRWPRCWKRGPAKLLSPSLCLASASGEPDITLAQPVHRVFFMLACQSAVALVRQSGSVYTRFAIHSPPPLAAHNIGTISYPSNMLTCAAHCMASPWSSEEIRSGPDACNEPEVSHLLSQASWNVEGDLSVAAHLADRGDPWAMALLRLLSTQIDVLCSIDMRVN